MQPPESKDELIIRTMKEDMGQMRSVPVVSALPGDTSNFPLPSKQEKTLAQMPYKKSGFTRSILIGCMTVILLGAVTAGGWYGYMWWASYKMMPVMNEQKHPVGDVIPKEALAVIVYDLSNDSKKTLVQLLWNAKGAAQQRSAIDGNPSELLGLSDIQGVYYVLMQDNPRPFLVLEKTDSTTQYVSKQSTVVPFEKDGWYILHRVGTDQYSTAISRGTFAESGGIPVLTSLSAVAQVILSAPYASKLFNDIASDALGVSRVAAVTFEVEPPAQDGTIHARAITSISAVPEKLFPSTDELKDLIPGDIEFGHIGFNFADDLNIWQQESARLDVSIIQQPAIRQFLSQLTTPYALFKRTGSDGVRDIGLIIELPESLKKNIKTGEPIIEQSLPALIPLVVGRVVGIQSAFHDGVYENVPVRYTNIAGQTQALDYTVGDSFILISSSREGMGALVDIAIGRRTSVKSNDPWKSLFEKSFANAQNRVVSLGNIQDSLLLSLIPTVGNIEKIPTVLSKETTSTDHILHATLLIEQ